jgi:hypothetical protein
LIQPFQQPERVVGLFNTYRQLYPVTRYTLREAAIEALIRGESYPAKLAHPRLKASSGAL